MYNSPFQNKIDLSLNLRHAHSFGQNKASCQISNSQTKKCPRATHLKFYIVITIWRAGQKWDLVITLTGGSYWPKTKASELHFARSFQGHPNWPYLARPNMCPNMPNMAKYANFSRGPGNFKVLEISRPLENSRILDICRPPGKFQGVLISP